MTTVNVTMKLTGLQAFDILLQTLDVELKENVPTFKVNEFGDIVCDYDDRGELYLALYHLATKICPNTEFRNLFEDPNTIMASLYTEAKAESENNGEASNERKIYEQVGDAMFFLPEYAYDSGNSEEHREKLIDVDRIKTLVDATDKKIEQNTKDGLIYFIDLKDILLCEHKQLKEIIKEANADEE